MSLSVTDASFKSEVLESKTPVLVDFWAPWCGPCKQLGPVVDELGTEMAGKLKVVKVNVDENQEYASQFSIRSIPTLILFKNGEVADKRVGGAPKAALKQWVESFI